MMFATELSEQFLYKSLKILKKSPNKSSACYLKTLRYHRYRGRLVLRFYMLWLFLPSAPSSFNFNFELLSNYLESLRRSNIQANRFLSHYFMISCFDWILYAIRTYIHTYGLRHIVTLVVYYLFDYLTIFRLFLIKTPFYIQNLK